MLWQRRAALAATLLLLALSLTGAAASAQTTATFSYDSEPGDYIGQGQSATFTQADGLFTFTRNFDNGVSMDFDGTERWSVDFAAPNEAELTPGYYPDAERFPFQSFRASRPLDVR